MPCNCRKGTTPPPTARAVAAGAQVYHEVWVNGAYSGYRSTSLRAAQMYADQRPGAEVRSNR